MIKNMISLNFRGGKNKIPGYLGSHEGVQASEAGSSTGGGGSTGKPRLSHQLYFL